MMKNTETKASLRQQRQITKCFFLTDPSAVQKYKLKYSNNKKNYVPKKNEINLVAINDYYNILLLNKIYSNLCYDYDAPPLKDFVDVWRCR